MFFVTKSAEETYQGKCMALYPGRSSNDIQPPRSLLGTSQANVDDFCRLHGEFLSEGKAHAGIIVIPRQRYSIGEKIRRLMELIDSVTAEEMRNRLEFL